MTDNKRKIQDAARARSKLERSTRLADRWRSLTPEQKAQQVANRDAARIRNKERRLRKTKYPYLADITGGISIDAMYQALDVIVHECDKRKLLRTTHIAALLMALSTLEKYLELVPTNPRTTIDEAEYIKRRSKLKDFDLVKLVNDIATIRNNDDE